MMPDLFAQSQARKSRSWTVLDTVASGRIVDLDNNWRQYQYRPQAHPTATDDPPGEGRMTGTKNSPTIRARHPRSKMPTRRSERRAIDLDVLNSHLGYFVRRVQVWVFQDFIRTLASIDISPAQFSVLVVIGANRGLSQAELASTLAIERARLVRLLHRLEGRGLIQRLQSTADGRRHELQLTPQGRTLLTRAKALAARHERALIEKLGAERHRILLDALRDF
jgi:DNA-binding MarR family transcriptional regulator